MPILQKNHRILKIPLSAGILTATIASMHIAAAHMSSPLRLGYVALVDCAPLLVARELGLFAKRGVDVELSMQPGWATIREKLIYRELEGAHALATMAITMRLGVGCPATEVETSLVLNLQGNAITLSRRLWAKGVRDGHSLRRLIRSEGTGRRMNLGVVSSVSSHHILMRRWLRSCGIDPDEDVRLLIVPPSLTHELMSSGYLEGYCVGEPWNSVAILAGDGWCAATSENLAPLHPEKALLVRSEFAASRAEEYNAMLDALREACQWCDSPKNRPALVDMLFESRVLNVPREALECALIGPFQMGHGESVSADTFILFSRFEANRPDAQKARWLTEGLAEARILPSDFARKRDQVLAGFHDEPGEAVPPVPTERKVKKSVAPKKESGH
ncbi:nitrate ABC transporter ATP-binding protein [Verrucomicrobia bacterium LW23]|nr:nitrate ABC transporter ATP-binding protein [Verrucomicrobia bacterium LW23]